MATEPVGITFIVPENQDAIGVYEAEGGIEVFETDEPYLLSDGKSLVDPMPVRMVGGPIYQDTLGNAQSALAITQVSSWTPADLFANGEQGSFWGPLPYYSDAAGTVEADWGDPVGLIPDASGNEQDWTQVTSTARPILGRVPVGGRRNLLRYTEDLGRSPWTDSVFIERTHVGDGWWNLNKPEASGASVSQTQGVIPANTVISCTIGLLAGETGSRLTLGLFQSGQGWSPADRRFVRVLSGPGNASIESPSRITGLHPTEVTYVQVTILTADVDNNCTLYIYPIGGDASSENIGDIVVGRPQVNILTALEDFPPPYQRVGNEFDITEAGVNEVHYLRFDGTDDQVTTTLPAISGGTIVLAGTNGIWIDELNFAGGAFSVGPDTYTGGPAGLMSILGDLLVGGGFVIDRALTPEEIAQVKKYYKARGSAGLFVLEPELVTNTGPFSEVPPWMLSASFPDTTLAAENGDLVMSSAGSWAAHAIQDLGADVFSTGLYVLRFGVSDCSLISQMRVGRSNVDSPSSIPGNVVDSGDATLGENYRIYNATGTATRYLYLGGRDDMKNLSISKISLRKLELLP